MLSRSQTSLLLGIFFVVSSLVLSACLPNPQDTDLDLSSQSMQTELSDTTGTNTLTEQELTMPLENGTKTLADFKEIAATQATIKTNKGDIVVELYRDKVPLTTANFVNLASEGYYDGIVFHRVIPDFMAQVGDPLTKDPAKQAMWGTGGPGYTIADEFDQTLKHDGPGILSMANAGPNTGGSQFFITYEATPWLDGKHAVFGKVLSGMDVLEQITVGDTITTITLN